MTSFWCNFNIKQAWDFFGIPDFQSSHISSFENSEFQKPLSFFVFFIMPDQNITNNLYAPHEFELRSGISMKKYSRILVISYSYPLVGVLSAKDHKNGCKRMQQYAKA